MNTYLVRQGNGRFFVIQSEEKYTAGDEYKDGSIIVQTELQIRKYGQHFDIKEQ